MNPGFAEKETYSELTYLYGQPKLSAQRWTLTNVDIDELWAELRATNHERDSAHKRFEAARDALVPRICSSYRIDEKWEDSANAP